MQIKKAVITGASAGIGAALAKLLAKNGIDLILTGRDAEKLEQVASEVSDQVQVKTILVELANKEQKEHLIRVIKEEVPDLVVNNAAYGLAGATLSYATDDVVKMMDVNCNALVEITLETARLWIAKKMPGVIMNISSAAAYFSLPGIVSYSATKAFVTSFSKGVDVELEEYGIRVLSCHPGRVATEFQPRAGLKKRLNPKKFLIMTDTFAAEAIWKQIQKGKREQVIDWKYRLLVFLGRYIVPESVQFYINRKDVLNKVERDLIL